MAEISQPVTLTLSPPADPPPPAASVVFKSSQMLPSLLKTHPQPLESLICSSGFLTWHQEHNQTQACLPGFVLLYHPTHTHSLTLEFQACRISYLSLQTTSKICIVYYFAPVHVIAPIPGLHLSQESCLPPLPPWLGILPTFLPGGCHTRARRSCY